MHAFMDMETHLERLRLNRGTGEGDTDIAEVVRERVNHTRGRSRVAKSIAIESNFVEFSTYLTHGANVDTAHGFSDLFAFFGAVATAKSETKKVPCNATIEARTAFVKSIVSEPEARLSHKFVARYCGSDAAEHLHKETPFRQGFFAAAARTSAGTHDVGFSRDFEHLRALQIDGEKGAAPGGYASDRVLENGGNLVVLEVAQKETVYLVSEGHISI